MDTYGHPPHVPNYVKTSVIKVEPPVAEWCFNGDWQGLLVRVTFYPNWFHRTMQRWILGIHWRRING